MKIGLAIVSVGFLVEAAAMILMPLRLAPVGMELGLGTMVLGFTAVAIAIDRRRR